ncbi:hypothetical protein HDU84_003280 [Entophlyctis sp. JEL0112]|nr:hypothetical protein HDU84_003280 [Entophlyctis sp. JEL0112]
MPVIISIGIALRVIVVVIVVRASHGSRDFMAHGSSMHAQLLAALKSCTAPACTAREWLAVAVDDGMYSGLARCLEPFCAPDWCGSVWTSMRTLASLVSVATHYGRVSLEFARLVGKGANFSVPTAQQFAEAQTGFGQIFATTQNGAWKKITVKEAAQFVGSGITVGGFFLVGEMVGRGSVVGYKIPGCVDGTWQYPGTGFDAPSQGGVKITSGLSPSNIVKIAYLLGNGTNPHDVDPAVLNQRVYYHSGVATEVDDKKSHDLEGNFGNIHSHLLDAYAWLAKTYKEGDEIYAFGFSRGSTIVRSLFSFIRFAGLAHADKFNDHDSLMERVNEAFDIYKSRETDPSGKSKKIAEFKEAHCWHHVDMKFIGVFDTVEALDVPKTYSSLVPSTALTEIEEAMGNIEPNNYHDLTIGTIVQHAYHAISIDEKRGYFPPTMFEAVDERKLPKGFTREQKWFRGSHADVGGGWWEKGLSDIALDWMIDNARKAGLSIRNHTEFDKEFNPFILGLDRDYYLSADKRVIHDYFAAYPNGNSPMGKPVPRNMKELMNTKLFYKSSLHESVTKDFKDWPIPANLKAVL